ncbi:DUF3679 domain-containing protein [Shimazuella sp. AN120528]|uniref:DUF3679 domain-containing protein n=1 Tax=Shimazuella soli TaxID=1892854 RepID=UPI001F0DABD8|nr:DUF3679 domain-containing protein [Shimazuella soli]MCH5583840.1 DUF3679 domain-containing protein [Shimazuella soli]
MRYSIQIMSLALVLLIGVFVGIDSAEKNIQKMQGIEGAPRAVQLSSKGDKLELNVLGQVVKSNKINPVQVQKVQKTITQSENVLSNIGNAIGSNMRYYSRMMLSAVFAWTK